MPDPRPIKALIFYQNQRDEINFKILGRYTGSFTKTGLVTGHRHRMTGLSLSPFLKTK
jgi:hypothetical protein